MESSGMNNLHYLDLFSGIGGFSLGFQQAGFHFKKHYYSEINKHAIKVYQRHWPDSVGLGSITEVTEKTVEKADIITFGFPCQDLSVAGKREGYEGKRSVLFFEAVRLIQGYKPTVFIFENVEGLLNHNEGRTFETTLRTIADLGLYECEWQLLNTSWFLPQNRPRLYFIGYLTGKCKRKIFPVHGYSIQNYRQQILTNSKRGNRNFFHFKLSSTEKRGKCSGYKFRYLTEIETERLQGFPDNWTDNISSTQRYRATGNAVSVPITRYIAKKLKENVIWE